LAASAIRRGAVGRAAGNLIKRHLSGMAVIEAHNHHAEMQKIGDDREEGRLLPAMLRRARRKRTADLAVQYSARPKSAGLVEEICHLR